MTLHGMKFNPHFAQSYLENDNLNSDIVRTEALHEFSNSDDFDMLLYEKIRHHSCGKRSEQRSHVWYRTVQTILKLWEVFIQNIFMDNKLRNSSYSLQNITYVPPCRKSTHFWLVQEWFCDGYL